MRNWPHSAEKHRITFGEWRTDKTDGNNGAFIITSRYSGKDLCVIASDGQLPPDPTDRERELAGWEHVSVSLRNRAPTWQEMCAVKSMFWDDNETVVQFHPSAEQYVDCHPHCLHLWKKVDQDFELPPQILVGPKDLDNLTEEERQAMIENGSLPPA